MSIATEVANFYPPYSPSMSSFFSDLISKNSAFAIIRTVADELDLAAARAELIDKAQYLARTLQVLADNPMPVSEEAVSGVRNALELLRGYVEDATNTCKFTDIQRNQLETAYLDIAQAISLVTIQNAYMA